MTHATDALIRKLNAIGRLSEADAQSIRDFPLRISTLDMGSDAVRAGDVTDQSCLLIEGFMHRYKDLPDGRRQILSFHVAGDIPDLHSLHLKKLDHSLAATSSCTVAYIKHADLKAAMRTI